MLSAASGARGRFLGFVCDGEALFTICLPVRSRGGGGGGGGEGG